MPPSAENVDPTTSQPASTSYTSDGISAASRRLRALAALSGSLTDALDAKAAADLIEQQAFSAFDATSAIVVTLGAFPPATDAHGDHQVHVEPVLHVVHAIGLQAEVSASLEQLPLDAPVPFAEVARTGEPLFLSSETELRRYPDWAVAMIAAGVQAAAIVPVWANGELRGVLGLTWARARVFDEDERAFVLTLGVMCAQAIMRAHLRAAERDAREDAVVARDTAERANESKAHFVATISHELRTPMNAVLGYTELLGDGVYGPVTDKQKEHLKRVRTSGIHLLGLVEDLLSYARIEAGHEVVHPEPVVLLEVVEASLAMVRPLAERKGLRIRVESPPQPVGLNTDPQKLRQILVNLLANAVKFTSVGDIVLVVRIAGLNSDLKIILEVTDTGRGMTEDEQSHVFDPFWRADHSSQGGGGSGLGLSVARRLARLLGGDVSVTQSAPSLGSTFVVWLPATYTMPLNGG